MRHAAEERYRAKPGSAAVKHSGSAAKRASDPVARRTPPKPVDHPVLDGAIVDPRIEHDVENPWRGVDDAGLVVHPRRKRRPGWHWFWE